MSTAYPQTGRADNSTNVSGPRAGAYNTFQFIFPAVANNDTLIQRVVVPFACRVMEVAIVSDSVTSDPTYCISNGAAGGTDILAAGNSPASDTAAVTAAASLSNRDLAKADVLTCTIVADAGDAATHMVVTITVWVRGHVVASPDND